MARFNFLSLSAFTSALRHTPQVGFFLLGGCASAMQPTAINVAPYPKTYTCSQLRDLSDKYQNLPDIVRRMLDDYSVERDALAKAHSMRLQCQRD